jgi:hypothetical protein
MLGSSFSFLLFFSPIFSFLSSLFFLSSFSLSFLSLLSFLLFLHNLSPLTTPSHLSPLTTSSHLSPLTSHLSPQQIGRNKISRTSQTRIHRLRKILPSLRHYLLSSLSLHRQQKHTRESDYRSELPWHFSPQNQNQRAHFRTSLYRDL